MPPSRGAGLLLFCLLASLSAGAFASAAALQRFQIVTGDDSALTRRIALDLHKRLVPVFADDNVEKVDDGLPQRKVYVAIGPVALREAIMRKPEGVVIAAFTSAHVWRSVVAEVPRGRKSSVTAIFAEPAPSDQLRLIQLLYKRPVRVSAIVSADTAFLKPFLQGAAEIEDYHQGDDINGALKRIAKAEALLAMPDREVYNTENIRNILLSTYRHNQGVIGFSSDMVKTGALASTYSEIEDINAQIAETAATFIATNELAGPQFPRYFRTIVNAGVARSLKVVLDDNVTKFGRRPPGVK
ncbi:hypothetical protein [Massilia glaciei]|uniref:hypothetical protein n=1 Tax=Massilia glaciei TaxID=1524097 RepID=UPI001E365179|nr:hypothetical protein [Massilia glaciei]